MEVLRPVTALPFEPVIEPDTNDTFHCSVFPDTIATNSMVSDSQMLREKFSIHEPTLDIARNNQHAGVRRASNLPEEAALEKEGSIIYEDEDITLHSMSDTQTLHPPRSPSASTIDSISTHGSASEHGSSFLHIRTGSIESSSSGESAHVDWEELDKNEKEEQKDECSDDVRTPASEYDT